MVLVVADNVFKVSMVLNLVLQETTQIKNGDRHTMIRMVEKDILNFVYELCRYLWLYHLNFDISVSGGHEGDQLDIKERGVSF
jgi:hypothetical protein